MKLVMDKETLIKLEEYRAAANSLMNKQVLKKKIDG